jgi:hypothetical protein
MTRLSISLACLCFTLAACGSKPANSDVLAEKPPGEIARITQCTVPSSDGVGCDRKTCRKDERSDCTIFRDRCKASGHDYDGGDDSGTCIRKDPVG